MNNRVKSTPKLGRPSKTSGVALTPERIAEAGTEHAHQTALFAWAALPEVRRDIPCLEYMFAIPNGGLRDKAQAARLKAEGVKSGVPDIFLPVPRRGLNGFFIELKRPADEQFELTIGRVSANQSKWIEYLQTQGYAAAVCYGWENARMWILTYLGG